MEKIIGSALAHKGDSVVVGYDEGSIGRAAKVLTNNLVLHNDSLTSLINQEELQECFDYALKVVLYQNTGSKPSYEVVPTFMSDLTMSLSLRERNTVVSVSGLSIPSRPNCYGDFLDIMGSLGFPCDKVLKVNPETRTRVLTVGELEMNGALMLVGIDSDVSIEELAVRAMLSVSAEQQAKLERIIGAYDYAYMSKEELIRQWGVSIAFAK